MIDTQEIYHQEHLRKEKMMDLFIEIEESEQKLSSRRKIKYDRTFFAWTTIVKIADGWLSLQSETGQVIEPVIITRELSGMLREGYELFIKAGFRNGEWHILRIEALGTKLPEFFLDS